MAAGNNHKRSAVFYWQIGGAAPRLNGRNAMGLQIARFGKKHEAHVMKKYAAPLTLGLSCIAYGLVVLCGRTPLPLTRLPSIRYASDRRRVAAITLDVSASRCVGESSTCRERKSGAENKRSAKRHFSGREHCLILSDQFAVFAAHCDGQTTWLNRHVEADRQIGRLFPVGLVAS